MSANASDMLALLRLVWFAGWLQYFYSEIQRYLYE